MNQYFSRSNLFTMEYIVFGAKASDVQCFTQFTVYIFS